MKKLSKLALAALVLSASVGIAKADTVDNWRDSSTGLTWMNGSGEHCWRDAFWTPETASSEKCGKPVQAPPVVEVPTPPVVVAPTPVPQISTEKFTFSADALFDFDKATLKADGKSNLDQLVTSLKDPSMKLEVVVAVGHTDSYGSDKYNNKLSTARADAVKNYLVAQGLDQARVYAEGKGEKQLKVEPASCPKKRIAHIACEAPNRRVEIEVSGVKTITTIVNPAPVQSPAQAPAPVTQ